jgi:hypothetical protein
MFNAPDGVYFRMPAGDTTLITRADTIVYTFAFDLTATRREISVPVEIIGFAATNDRTYRLEITNYGDVREGVHYDAINPVQTFPAGKMRDSLRVTFHRTPDMLREAKKIGLTIIDGGDLAKGVRERLHVSIQVSDVLEKPEWWDRWNVLFGGAYDPQIYKVWMGIWGGKGDLSAYNTPNWWGAPQVLTAIIDLKAYFDQHETYYLDRPTVRIIIPYPS